MLSDASINSPDGHPLDPGDVRVDLPELDTVETVLRLTARGGSQRDVADLDVQHELQILLPDRSSGVHQLQAGLRGERLLRGIDLHDLREAVHADDGAGGGSAGCERVIAAHGAHRARILVFVAQNLLQFLNGLGMNVLLRSRGDSAVVVRDARAHAGAPCEEDCEWGSKATSL